jgi:hypothetical protein
MTGAGSSGSSASTSLRRVMLGGDLEELFGGDFDLDGPSFLRKLSKTQDERLRIRMTRQTDDIHVIVKVHMSENFGMRIFVKRGLAALKFLA